MRKAFRFTKFYKTKQVNWNMLRVESQYSHPPKKVNKYVCWNAYYMYVYVYIYNIIFKLENYSEEEKEKVGTFKTVTVLEEQEEISNQIYNKI